MAFLERTQIGRALALLGEHLKEEDLGPFQLVVCGGASLLSLSLISRTTRDVDVIALMNERDQLVSPDPLPDILLRMAKIVAEDLDLDDHWLNNEPSRGVGGIFQLGLPEGLAGRLTKKEYGPNLTVYFVGRLDQIFFKVYSAADRGAGRHLSDLLSLKPAEEELEQAARWSMTHDTSEEYRTTLKSMFTQMGYSNVAKRI